jgi:hypothetical protein
MNTAKATSSKETTPAPGDAEAAREGRLRASVDERSAYLKLAPLPLVPEFSQWPNMKLTTISTFGKMVPWAKRNDRLAPAAGHS